MFVWHNWSASGETWTGDLLFMSQTLYRDSIEPSPITVRTDIYKVLLSHGPSTVSLITLDHWLTNYLPIKTLCVSSNHLPIKTLCVSSEPKLVKIADLQAHNTLQSKMLWDCRSAIFTMKYVIHWKKRQLSYIEKKDSCQMRHMIVSQKTPQNAAF